MFRQNDNVLVKVNFDLRAFERGKYVRGTHRIGHNVFTNTGKDWLAHLSAWSTIGSGADVPYTRRRVRWMGLGTGTQAEDPSAERLVTPASVSGGPAGFYLAAIQSSRKTGARVEFYREFATNEISQPAWGLDVVPVTEAGMFVDVSPADPLLGVDDSPIGGGFDTTLSPKSQFNPPITYKTFEEVNKTIDFSIVVQWTLIFQ